MKKTLITLLLIMATTVCSAATTFDIEVRDSSGDYTSYSDAKAVFLIDITDEDATRVHSFDASAGTIADGEEVTTDGGATSGICVHQSINDQILIRGIAGGTFDDNDIIVGSDGGGSATLSDDGDGVDVDITIYDDGTWIVTGKQQ